MQEETEKPGKSAGNYAKNYLPEVFIPGTYLLLPEKKEFSPYFLAY